LGLLTFWPARVVFAQVQFEERPVREAEPAQRAGRDISAGHIVLLGLYQGSNRAALDSGCAICGGLVEKALHAAAISASSLLHRLQVG
jgi:hypothetical protein